MLDTVPLILEPDPYVGDTLAGLATAGAVRARLPKARIVVRTRYPDLFDGVAEPAARRLQVSCGLYVRQSQNWRARAIRRRARVRGETDGVWFMNVGIDLVNRALGTNLDMGTRATLTATDAGPAIERPYWVTVSGGRSKEHSKFPPLGLLERVVGATCSNVRWVQTGLDHHPDVAGADRLARLSLAEWIGVVARAEGVLCGVGGTMHLAAAVGTRSVVLVGGAESPEWACYPEHDVFHTCGAMDCCPRGACWRGTCDRDKACYGLIDADQVIAAVSGERFGWVACGGQHQ